MESRKTTVITIQTTPKELRRIADTMEIAYPKLTAGESTITTTVRDYNSDITIAFSVDQQRMEHSA